MVKANITTTQEEQEFFQKLQKQGNFDIKPCEVNIDFNRFEKLKLTEWQQAHISELIQHIPAAAAAGTMAKSYIVKFPKGLPHTLMSLKQGGFGSQIINNGKIAGSAAFFPLFRQAAILNIFTAMSILTGQFFLVQIRKELHAINKKLDDILKFLYREKKAELLSEENFIKYAYDNYTFIMAHELQQNATIINIQNAKKIAVKDIEFYLNDLKDKIKSGTGQNFNFLDKLIDNEIKPIIDNLNCSLQLYLRSSLLEVYYAQNFEKEYISNIKNEIINYTKYINDDEISECGTLIGYLRNANCKANVNGKRDKHIDKLEQWKNLMKKEYNAIYENVGHVLDKAIQQDAEYYMEADGNVYYKIS